MKKLLLLLIALSVISPVKAQVRDVPATAKQKKFHAGAFYSFSSTRDKVTDLSISSEWYGQDLGTITYNQHELDSINSIRTEEMDFQKLVADFGMVFINKTRWHFSGDVFFGISKTRFETKIDQPENNQKKVKSEFNDPIGGLSLNLRYSFTERWGLAIMPSFQYSWGSADVIEDSIVPNVNFFINNLDEKYDIGYGRVDLFATYQVKGLLISLGPGFYYSFINRTYSIDRTDPETNQKYYDEVRSSLRTESFIDGCLRADWTIIDPLTLSAEFAAGKDLYLQAGLFYNF